MNIKVLANKIIKLASNNRARSYLFWVCVFEAFILPIPPDLMLMPMTAARPQDSYNLTKIALTGAVLGSIVGYCIGFFLFKTLFQPIIQYYGFEGPYAIALTYFERYGFWSLLVAGATPIPLKLFTVTAGMLKHNFFSFILAVFLGRGSRFLLVTSIVRFGRRNLFKANSSMLNKSQSLKP